MNDLQSKRQILIIASAIDAALGGSVILIYFNILPVDISSWDIPRWVIGAVGGVWFVAALVVLLYQLTKADSAE
jgi:integral membrane sensor domain MASE1